MQLLLLLEMESKFTIRRPRHAADVLTRVDKFIECSLQQLESVKEFACLKQLARMQFFIPFEINKKAQLNLQVSEQFTCSYLNKDYAFIKRRADSVFGERDTGFKLTMIFVIGIHEDRPGPTFRLYRQDGISGGSSSGEPVVDIVLSANTMILFNSRAFEYEYIDATAKTFLLINQVPGPA